VVAEVAQLVEQRFRKPQVVGSNPTFSSHIILESPAPQQDFLLLDVKKPNLFGLPLLFFFDMLS
jgi:hypothetical protein